MKNFQKKSTSLPNGVKSSNPHCGCSINFGATIRVFFAGAVLRCKIDDKINILLVKDGKDQKFQIPGGKYEQHLDAGSLKNTLFREASEELFDKFNLDYLKAYIEEELDIRSLLTFVGGGNYYHQFITLNGYQSYNLFVVFDIPEDVFNTELHYLKELEESGNIIFYDGKSYDSEKIRDRDYPLLDGFLRMKVPVNRI